MLVRTPVILAKQIALCDWFIRFLLSLSLSFSLKCKGYHLRQVWWGFGVGGEAGEGGRSTSL